MSVRASAKKKSPGALLRSLFERHLDATIRLFPESASQLGFSEFRDSLGENTPAVYREMLAISRELLAEAEALPTVAFEGLDWLDRREFVSQLRTEIFSLGGVKPWRRNPQVHLDGAVSSIFELVVQSRGKIATEAEAICRRMEAVPGYLDNGLSCLRDVEPLWAGLAEKSAAGADEFFGSLAGEIEARFPLPMRQRALDAVSSTRRAVVEYAAAVRRRRPAKEGSFAVGRKGMEFLMRERLGLDWSLPEAAACGKWLVEKLRAEVEAEAKRLGNRTARELLDAAARGWQPSLPLIDIYTETTHGMRAAVERKKLASIPAGESLRVLSVPPFMKHQFPTAAYSAPGPFARRQEGIFWVNDLSNDVVGAGRKAEEIRQHYGVELTCAHEAYPGHHLQFVVQNRLPSRIRRMANHSIFYEGWTLWCENLVVGERLAEFPELRLLQLNDALWRAYRIVIDCGIHGGGMTLGQACKELMRGVGFTKARAMGDLHWYSSSPSVPMSYLLGRLGIEELHRRFVMESPGAGRREFHDRVLAFGAVPWTWIQKVW